MEKNKIGFIFFSIILLVIVVGGFVLMKQSENSDNTNTTFIKKLTKEEEKEIRLDTEKDYIYFTDTDKLVEELDITYQTINFNFDGVSSIEDKLNNENKELKDTVKYDDTLETDAYDKLTYAKYSIYTVYTYDSYISLIVDYYEFNQEDLITYTGGCTYIFNKNTGSIISNEELLKTYNLTESDVLDKIKDYVEDQNLLKDNEELDSDATIENIDTLALYVDKIGRLTASVLVKSDQKDYNDSVILS